MKVILTALFVALLMVGCGEPDLDDKETLAKIIAEAIDHDKLQYRGKKGEELKYAPNEQTPYTGWTKWIYDNVRLVGLSQYKDGKLNGLATLWYENGQKGEEGNYKDGLRQGLATYWYVNGQKEREQENLFGLPMSAVVWKPNGEKCPVTNLKDGNGVVVIYNDDGTENYRDTY